MATTYADIKPLRDAGKTNAEIAASLLGRRWTVRAIPAADLIDWLRENRVDGVPVARFDPSGAWEGVLPTLVSGGTLDAAVEEGIRELLSHLRNSKSVEVGTHATDRGVLLHSIAAAAGISANQRTSLYALGGGERFADSTEAKVAELIADHDLLSLYRDMHSKHIVPVLDGDNQTTADLVAAFRAAADELEAA